MLDQILDDGKAGYFVFKVGILDACFDRIERGCNRNRRNGPCNGCDKVLCPSCLGVISYTKGIFFCCSGCAEELRGRFMHVEMDAYSLLTAKLPGALRAMVQPHPRYNADPSSLKMRMTPRPRNASGLTWRLILSTSRGRRT